MPMKFSAIKCHNHKVMLAWQLSTHGEKDVATATLTSEDGPQSEFTEALEAFKPELLTLLELPELYGKDDLEVTKLSINRETDGRLGLVITGLKTLGHGSLVLNTPHLRERLEEGEPGEGYLTDALLTKIATAEAAAERYVGGQRQQADLFDHDEAA